MYGCLLISFDGCVRFGVGVDLVQKHALSESWVIGYDGRCHAEVIPEVCDDCKVYLV